jgi:hypothetical protein
VVGGSIFEIKSDHDSPGIQIADVALWLYQQFRKGRPLEPTCERLLHFILARAWENDFSFDGVDRAAAQKMGHIMEMPLTDETEAKVREMLATAEQARQESMARYEIDQIPPFMRESPQGKST